MPNEFKPRCHPRWGIPLEFSLSDIPKGYQKVVPVVDKAAVTTLSAAVEAACHGVQVTPTLERNTVTCTIELYKVDGGDVLVKSWAVTRANVGVLFASNLEHVDLGGKPIKIKVISPTGGWVSVGYKKMY